MSHTNSTTNYGLPQFLTGDKPAWLTDVNNAFSDIDSAIYAAQTKADTAFTDAGNAQSDATTAINNAAAADAKGSGAIASIEAAFDPTTIYSVGAKVMYNSLLYRCIVAVTTPGPWTGSDNWERITVDSLISTSDSKIGSLTSLSTTDKSSLVGAVNEVNGNTKPTTVTPTFNSSQSNYSIPFNNTRVYKIGNVVYFTSTIQVNTPYGSSPGQDVYSGLPRPYSNDNIYMGFCAWNIASSNMRVIVTSDGKLQCRGGNTGTAYDILFSYVCQ